jgi:hypothetical protein
MGRPVWPLSGLCAEHGRLAGPSWLEFSSRPLMPEVAFLVSAPLQHRVVFVSAE